MDIVKRSIDVCVMCEMARVAKNGTVYFLCSGHGHGHAQPIESDMTVEEYLSNNGQGVDWINGYERFLAPPGCIKRNELRALRILKEL